MEKLYGVRAIWKQEVLEQAKAEGAKPTEWVYFNNKGDAVRSYIDCKKDNRIEKVEIWETPYNKDDTKLLELDF